MCVSFHPFRWLPHEAQKDTPCLKGEPPSGCPEQLYSAIHRPHFVKTCENYSDRGELLGIIYTCTSLKRSQSKRSAKPVTCDWAVMGRGIVKVLDRNEIERRCNPSASQRQSCHELHFSLLSPHQSFSLLF